MPIPGLPGVTDFTLFGGLNVCVVGWALLACPPSWRPKRWKAVVLGLCFVFGVLYVVTLANALVTGLVPEQAGFGTLDGVTELFKVREVVFSGWTHFVCHDLLVGVWVAEDSQKRGVPHIAFATVTLPLLCLAGPAGVVAHLTLAQALSAIGGKRKAT
jgi:hypothetical protein